MRSNDTIDVYATNEPQTVFMERVQFCLDIHNEAVLAMSYPRKVLPVCFCGFCCCCCCVLGVGCVCLFGVGCVRVYGCVQIRSFTHPPSFPFSPHHTPFGQSAPKKLPDPEPAIDPEDLVDEEETIEDI